MSEVGHRGLFRCAFSCAFSWPLWCDTRPSPPKRRRCTGARSTGMEAEKELRPHENRLAGSFQPPTGWASLAWFLGSPSRSFEQNTHRGWKHTPRRKAVPRSHLPRFLRRWSIEGARFCEVRHAISNSRSPCREGLRRGGLIKRDSCRGTTHPWNLHEQYRKVQSGKASV